MTNYGSFGGNLFGNYAPRPKKKRNVSHALKLWAWENKTHKCYVCGRRVNKQSEAEFDHTRAYSKGGATDLTNVKISHRFCNRIKGDKSISRTHRILGIKSNKKKIVTRRKRRPSRKPLSFWGI
ncbi:HNH endonuclease [Candidatus Woesearchaeota archaeon]|nr:HNH endonuclease [Candidatus Woesearchaeota archaeon]